jgi:DNA replication protein DnaC
MVQDGEKAGLAHVTTLLQNTSSTTRSDSFLRNCELELIGIDNQRRYHSKTGYECPICLNKGGASIHLTGEELKAYNRRHGFDENYRIESGQTVWQICRCGKINSAIQQNKKCDLGRLLKYKMSDYQAEKPYQVRIKNLAEKYLDEVKQDNLPWFLFSGQSGIGKTMICSIICNALIKANRVVRYLIYPEFVDEIKSKSFDQQIAMMDDYANVEILYVDDLFKGTNTETDLKNLFRLINRRYSLDKITIFSTEYSLDQLYDLNEAITGRIEEMAKGFILILKREEERNYRKLKR